MTAKVKNPADNYAAELVGTYEHDTPEWHAARLAVVGSSDVASILGVGYKSAYTLWHEKRGLVEPEPVSPRMQRKYAYGHHMEPFVAGLFMADHPDLILRATGSWRHKERPWQGCNPDRLVYPDGSALATSLVELKTFPTLADWEGGPPVGYRAQLLWQVDTFGFEGGWLAGYANLGGDYVDYYYEADPFEAEAVRALVLEFFNSDTPPPIDGSVGTYATIRKLNPSITPKQETEVPAEIAEAYLAARDNYKAADSDLTKWKGHLLAHMGTAQFATYEGQKIASRVAVRDGVPYLKESSNA